MPLSIFQFYKEFNCSWELPAGHMFLSAGNSITLSIQLSSTTAVHFVKCHKNKNVNQTTFHQLVKTSENQPSEHKPFKSRNKPALTSHHFIQIQLLINVSLQLTSSVKTDRSSPFPLI